MNPVNRSSPRQPPDDDERYQQIRATTARLLARREHSQRELRVKLWLRYTESELIEQAIDEFRRCDLQSDERFAEIYVRTRAERGYGPRRILAELRERGVDANLAEAHLSDWSGYWADSAARQLDKRFGGQVPADLPARARQTRFLMQRGFTAEQIDCVLRA